VVGKPATSVIAFSSNDFHIYRLSAEMSKRGWTLNGLQFPSAYAFNLIFTKVDK
jgi:sphinganine-1-phosphate aldolase